MAGFRSRPIWARNFLLNATESNQDVSRYHEYYGNDPFQNRVMTKRTKKLHFCSIKMSMYVKDQYAIWSTDFNRVKN